MSARYVDGLMAGTHVAEWSDLEQAFFDSAPPDEPEPAGEPECFDDLAAPRRPPLEHLGGLLSGVAAAFAALWRVAFDPARRSRPASPL